jgi:hypothetical protein
MGWGIGGGTIVPTMIALMVTPLRPKDFQGYMKKNRDKKAGEGERGEILHNI